MPDHTQEYTLYVGNLDEQVDDALIYELMLQAAPVVSVHLPKDRVSLSHQGYGFVEFQNLRDAQYAASLFASTKLYGKPLKINYSGGDKALADVGAQLYIGNLDPMVDEAVLETTFSSFGNILAKRIERDDSGRPKGYGFVTFDSFASADNAIANMKGQYLMNNPCTISYAFKEGGQGRHGDEVERKLEAAAKENGYTLRGNSGNGPADAGSGSGNGSGGAGPGKRPPKRRKH